MNNLSRLIGRRLVALPIMIIGISFLVLFIMSLSPIDPAYSALGETASPKALEAYQVEHGLDKPFFVQYGLYLLGMLHDDLGTYSVGTSNKVSDLAAQTLPVTFQLTFLGLFFAVLFAFPLGVFAAIYRDRWPDQMIRVISVVSIGIPSFQLAALLALGLVGKPPISGALPVFSEDPGGWFLRMLFPAIALAMPVVRQMTHAVRTPMVEELDRNYVHTALGAGTPKWVVVAHNALRNALITPIIILGLRVNHLMGGAIVIEIIFAIDGMDKAVLLKGIRENWVTLVQGNAPVVAIAFIVINIIADMLYLFISPRIRSV